MVEVPIERCATGVKGFDLLCNGGFVRNSDNVILGGPGSGKTTFLLQFLYNGTTVFNENGLYCSFEPDIIETLNDGMAYGWDFARLNEENRIKFLKFSPYTAIDELKSEMLRLVSRYQVKRVCFDPISVLALNIGDAGKVRETVFELSSLMKRLKVTCLMADETFEEQDLLGKGPSNNYAKTDIIRFLSDSVIMFFDSKMTSNFERSLKIVKMRRTNHSRKFIGMDITNTGVVVDLNATNPESKPNYYPTSPQKTDKKFQNISPPKIKRLQVNQMQQTPQVVNNQMIQQPTQSTEEAPESPQYYPPELSQQEQQNNSTPIELVLNPISDPYELTQEEQEFLENSNQQPIPQNQMVESDDGSIVKRPMIA